MNKMLKCGLQITLDEIENFEVENNIKLPKLYKKFLFKHNGGFPKLNIFYISDDIGESSVNVFFGIKEKYNDLGKLINEYKRILPKCFIPIAIDPGGNPICLGISKPYYAGIYYYNLLSEDYEQVIFLAKNIEDFFNMFYKKEE